MNKKTILLCVFSFLLYSPLIADNIGLLITATGKYINFVPPLLASARKHFCTNHTVTYFIFTDGQLPEEGPDVVVLPHKILGWPLDTMLRCKAYLTHQESLGTMDYLFACDADMLFVDTVGNEILSDLVATLHPGFYGRSGTPETRKESTAYLNPQIKRPYFAGGFHGGTRENFLQLCQTMYNNIMIDSAKGITAVWHDESHLNRYFADNQPTLILDPSYCFPENIANARRWGCGQFKGKLLALDKDHAAFRVASGAH